MSDQAGERRFPILSDWTLVLNRYWVPISVTTVLRALCKIYDGAARVVNPSDYSVHDFASWIHAGAQNGTPYVRSSRLKIPVPEVIVLTRYGGLPTRTIAFTRWNLVKRDRHTCQYCGFRPGRDQLTIDHIVPRSQGGSSGWDNCVVACISCNTRKGNRSLRDAGYKLRRAPFRPTWSPQMVIGESSSKESWSKFLNGRKR